MTIVGIGGKGFIIKHHIITDDFQLPPLTLLFVTERGSPLSSTSPRLPLVSSAPLDSWLCDTSPEGGRGSKAGCIPLIHELVACAESREQL